MFCSQCGNKLQDNVKFCSSCGCKVISESQSNIVKLRCRDCGGKMTIDDNREVIACPFCGSEEIILESDSLKAERVRSDARVKVAYANRDAKIEKYHAERDVKVAEYDYNDRKGKRSFHGKVLTLIAGLAAMILAVLLLLVGFSTIA